MNRQNFYGHLALALTVILIAAFAGQLRRWQREHREVLKREALANPYGEMEGVGPGRGVQNSPRRSAEVLVRFKAGTAIDRITNIISDRREILEDEIETVEGLD